ncbi:MAG: hypothetical protein AABY22_29315, partial [Nanoarchaeota archaeon]
EYQAQQASIACANAGGDWQDGRCDMGDVAARRARTETIRAWAPWAAIGAGAALLTGVTVYAISRRAA